MFYKSTAKFFSCQPTSCNFALGTKNEVQGLKILKRVCSCVIYWNVLNTTLACNY